MRWHAGLFVLILGVASTLGGLAPETSGSPAVNQDPEVDEDGLVAAAGGGESLVVSELSRVDWGLIAWNPDNVLGCGVDPDVALDSLIVVAPSSETLEEIPPDVDFLAITQEQHDCIYWPSSQMSMVNSIAAGWNQQQALDLCANYGYEECKEDICSLLVMEPCPLDLVSVEVCEDYPAACMLIECALDGQNCPDPDPNCEVLADESACEHVECRLNRSPCPDHCINPTVNIACDALECLDDQAWDCWPGCQGITCDILDCIKDQNACPDTNPCEGAGQAVCALFCLLEDAECIQDVPGCDANAPSCDGLVRPRVKVNPETKSLGVNVFLADSFSPDDLAYLTGTLAESLTTDTAAAAISSTRADLESQATGEVSTIGGVVPIGVAVTEPLPPSDRMIAASVSDEELRKRPEATMDGFLRVSVYLPYVGDNNHPSGGCNSVDTWEALGEFQAQFSWDDLQLKIDHVCYLDNGDTRWETRRTPDGKISYTSDSATLHDRFTHHIRNVHDWLVNSRHEVATSWLSYMTNNGIASNDYPRFFLSAEGAPGYDWPHSSIVMHEYAHLFGAMHYPSHSERNSCSAGEYWSIMNYCDAALGYLGFDPDNFETVWWQIW